MTNPAENLCQANLIMTRLNTAMRDCNKENMNEITLLCTSIREQMGEIRMWAMNGQNEKT